VRVAIYGGSFNPPHIGHALVAAWIRWTDQADAVWLLPAFQHAFDKPLAPWPLRLALTQALADTLGPWARVEPIEADLPVPSFTIHTLETLAARHPTCSFSLVIGADVLGQLSQWKDVTRLRQRFPLIVVGRQGHPPVEGAPSFPDISSTEIRARLASGQPVGHLVPAAVGRVLAASGVSY
jgi:nicotinate-nucleotide adenylyltransferase